MYKSLDNKPNFIELEHRILKYWEETGAFDKLREQLKGNPRWSFLDGPITANNPMGVHHAWGRTYKDIFQRYKAMNGFDQRFQNGFDCQGLWIEVEVEKELGFKTKFEIETYGVARFVEKCKDRVRQFADTITSQSIRLGQWMDWDNSYYTFSDTNNYAIWLFLKRCHERGWIYKGADVMPWCPRCATGISQHEIVTEGYKELTHSGVTLLFPLVDRPGEFLLVWTTTPWTLTSNVGAAVGPELTYVKVKNQDKILYLSKGTLSVLVGEYQILEELPGKTMVGWKYQGPFDELPAQRKVGGHTSIKGLAERLHVASVDAHQVIAWGEVGEEEGTGIVHIAPGCGAEDFVLGKEHGLPAIAPLNEMGYFEEEFDWLTGKYVGDVAQPIFDNLQEKGILYKVENYTHRYPVCWRCSSELIFRLVDEWFIKMEDLRYQIIDVAKKIQWIPEYGLELELDWLRNMRDWMISKKRYYGLALPIYECQSCGHFDVIGGRQELQERAVEGWDRFEGHSPHRPWVDEVKIACSNCGETVSRIPDVGNPWLDAGIVPYSTMGYMEDRKHWEKWFPADFITECFPGQFRNWFYSLLAMSTVMENREPFKFLLGHALVKDQFGNDMHKSAGNAIWFDEAAEQMGADVMRWIFAGHNPLTNLNFGFDLGTEVTRKLLTLWNTVSFFTTYAELDGWKPGDDPGERDLLDRWVLSRLQTAIEKCREALDAYNTASAIRELETTIDMVSTWYVRRSRRRFWKSSNDSDKAAAYQTLYTVLTTLVRLLAPILPFLTEELHGALVRGVDADAPISVHLESYPTMDESLKDSGLESAMEDIISLVSIGRSIRSDVGIKVRQPLGEMRVVINPQARQNAAKPLLSQISQEINVKEITFSDNADSLVAYRAKPNLKVLGPKLGAKLKQVSEAISALESATVKSLADGQSIQLDGMTLSAEDLLINQEPLEGWAVKEEGGITVALNTQITDALRYEGDAREFIHSIQNLRKEMGFDVSDRIQITINPSEALKPALDAHRDFICHETLATSFKVKKELTNSNKITINGEPANVVIIKDERESK
jgi:isoleucyl-tRNA synthetase